MVITDIIHYSQQILIFLLSHPFSLILPLLIIFLSSIYRWMILTRTPKKNLPPSPPGLPIIGNLHQLGNFPFRPLQTLSEKHGDIMLLHLGNKPTLVASSAESATLVLKTHDHVCAGRPQLRTFTRLLPNGKDLTGSPLGEHWRQMKSICMNQLLSKARVESFRKVREEEVANMIESIKGEKVVNLREIFMELNHDITCRVAFGKKYREEQGDIDFTKLLTEFMKLLGGVYIGDYVSWLAWIDKINGVDAAVDKVGETFDRFLERILQDHEKRARERDGDGDGGDNVEIVKDFVDVLLEAQRDEKCDNSFLDRDSMKGLIQDIFADGTDSITTVLEWIMSELLRNPRVMRTLQDEVSRIIGDREIVTQDDLESMNYLKVVIKEGLRLHTPCPLLVPHDTTTDFKMKGYDISGGTQVLVNAWAISRNPKYWDEPERFHPERFINSSVDFKGHDFQFTPFGSGRRICPGMAYALANIDLVIANLVHQFDWSLPDGASGESLDMTESPGITIPKKFPLLAVPSLKIK